MLTQVVKKGIVQADSERKAIRGNPGKLRGNPGLRHAHHRVVAFVVVVVAPLLPFFFSLFFSFLFFAPFNLLAVQHGAHPLRRV